MLRYLSESHFTLDDIQFQKKLVDDSKFFDKYKYGLAQNNTSPISLHLENSGELRAPASGQEMTEKKKK